MGFIAAVWRAAFSLLIVFNRVSAFLSRRYKMHIPRQSGHRFQRKPATDSD